MPENPLNAIETSKVRGAEDGSEILFGLARVLSAVGRNERYVDQVREAANAVRDLTDLHVGASADVRDSAFGAAEHAREIRHNLRLGSLPPHAE